MEKLPEDFKRKWIEALRSGEYKQGRGYLIDMDRETYCCLGVACAISGGNFSTAGEGQYPSPDNFGVPVLLRGKNDLTTKLAYMNDGIDTRDHSFSEIADWIQENL